MMFTFNQAMLIALIFHALMLLSEFLASQLLAFLIKLRYGRELGADETFTAKESEEK